MIKAFKKGLIGFGLIGVGSCFFWLCGEVSAQSSHLFRTYKHEVPQKLQKTPEAVAEGKKVYEKRCWYCHGIEGKGDGPASKTMFPKPRNFTRNEYKVRSTTLGSVPTDEDLFRIITSGIEGTAMSFWNTISETERWQVIFYVKTFNEQFMKDVTAKVVSVVSIASTPESVKRGQELFKKTNCYECHGEDGRGNGLTTATRSMAQGQLDQQVPVRSGDELGELAQAFNQMSTDLARANRSRKQMTADIVHDLRNPLMVLSGYLESLQDGKLKPTPERFAVMQAEVTHLQRLVEDLRTLSLVDAGELKLHLEPTSIPELLERVAEAYRHQAEQQQINLKVEIEPNLPEINIDPTRMEQVLGNLVSNALRYTPEGGEILLSAKQVKRSLTASVLDRRPRLRSAPPTGDKCGGSSRQSDRASPCSR